MTIPPPPPGWNQTLEDLMADLAAGRRTSVGSPEAEWALAYERSLLPPDLRFPQDGDVYEPVEAVEVDYLTQWAAPTTGGGRGRLQPGQRLRVSVPEGREPPLRVNAVPLAYREVERQVIPFWTRYCPGYGGFCFTLSVQELAARFRQVPPEA